MDQKPIKTPHPPVNLRIKFRSESLPQFIERYATDVSRGGIFIRTREPLAVGTQLKLDFQYQGGAPLMAGDGTVVWVREFDPSRANVPPGMGVRFDKLAPDSQVVLEQILVEKAAREGGHGGAGSGRPGPSASLSASLSEGPAGARRTAGAMATAAPPAAAPAPAPVPPPAPALPSAAPASPTGAPAGRPGPPQAAGFAEGRAPAEADEPTVRRSVLPIPALASQPSPPRAVASPVAPVTPSPAERPIWTRSIVPAEAGSGELDELDEEPTQIAIGLPSFLNAGGDEESAAPRLPGMAVGRPSTGEPPSKPVTPGLVEAADDAATTMATHTATTAADKSVTGPPARGSQAAAEAIAVEVAGPESSESTTESGIPSQRGALDAGLRAGEGQDQGGGGGVTARPIDDDSSSATTTTPVHTADLLEPSLSALFAPKGPSSAPPAGAPKTGGAGGAGEATQSLSLDDLQAQPPGESGAPSPGAEGTATGTPGTPARPGREGSHVAASAPRGSPAEAPPPPSAAHARERRLPAPLILGTVIVLAASGFFLVRFFRSQATESLSGIQQPGATMEGAGPPPPGPGAAEPAAAQPPPQPQQPPAGEPPVPTAEPTPAAAAAVPSAAGADAARGPAREAAPAPAPSTLAAPAGAAAGTGTGPGTETTDGKRGQQGTGTVPTTPEAGPGPPDANRGAANPSADVKPGRAGGPKHKPVHLARSIEPKGNAGTGAAHSGAGAPASEDAASESPAAASKPTAATSYELKISSKPAGGEVSLDGNPVGKTPLSVPVGDLTSPHFVTIRKEGFELFEEQVKPSSAWVKVRVGKGGGGASTVQQLKLSPKLKPLSGTVGGPTPEADGPAGEAAPKVDKVDRVDKSEKVEKAEKVDDDTLPLKEPVAPAAGAQ
jgi:molecular chaperone DnaK